jgi:hypothetical protein
MRAQAMAVKRCLARLLHLLRRASLVRLPQIKPVKSSLFCSQPVRNGDSVPWGLFFMVLLIEHLPE